MPAGMVKSVWIAVAGLAAAGLVTAGLAAVVLLPAAAQQQPSAPAAPPSAQTLLDRTKCLAEADRFGQSLRDQVERGVSAGDARRELRSTVEQMQDALRSACVAISSPAAGEALAQAEKLTDSVLQGLKALRAGREGGELTEEQRKSLENLARQLKLDELGAWLSQFAQTGLEQALREYDKALQSKQFCMFGICVVPEQRERDEPRRNRGGEPDSFRL
jgi:hypothetical protein